MIYEVSTGDLTAIFKLEDWGNIREVFPSLARLLHRHVIIHEIPYFCEIR